MDAIIHIGMILNELITNSAKYAFSQEEGKIDIRLDKTSSGYILHYADDGKGLSDCKMNKDGFGLNLIALSTKQLEGVFNILTPEKGFACTITFKGVEV